jgi:hypothetical protein
MDTSENDVLALIAQGEGKTLEFKRGLQQDEKIARTLAAFANTRGGVLLVGVGDRGDIVGAPRLPKTVSRLERIAREVVEPPLVIDVSIATVRGLPVVCASVPLSSLRPHTAPAAYGERRVIVRLGSSNRIAKPAALKAIREELVLNLHDGHRRVLRWLADREGSLDGFISASGVGKQRARRAFEELERAGLIAARGFGSRRSFRRM